ncbi:hypothetical protein LXA43DRAFT_532584 [Ganoderma leucocontextum]|nr:hypothetical protein LXA43DRAFT_532584 [Ganoderma leucocontextum]
MSTTKSAAPADSWGSPAATAVQRRAKPAADTVRDDWDDDDDELEEAEDPQRLWEEANQRAPMPELVIAGSSTSGAAATSPPPAAFQPSLRILKRPTASSSSSSSASSLPTAGSGSSNASSSTYAEREARYQAARDRIFGNNSPSPGTPSEPSQPKTQNSAPKRSPPSVQIVREPKGPSIADPEATSPDGRGQGDDSRGFGSRRGKRRGGGKP